MGRRDVHGSDPSIGPSDRLSQLLRPAFAVLCMAAVLAAVLLLLWWALRALLLAFAGFLFAVFLESSGRYLCRHIRLPYAWSLVVVTILLIVIPGLAGWLIGVRISEQIGQFTRGVSDSINQLRGQIEHTPWLKSMIKNPAEVFSPGDVISQLGGVTSGAVEFLVDVLVIIFVGLFAQHNRTGIDEASCPWCRRRSVSAPRK